MPIAAHVRGVDRSGSRIWGGESPYDIKGKYWNVSTVKTQWPEIVSATL